METQFIRATAAMLAVNLAYAIVAVIVAILALKLIDRLLLKRIDLEEEIKKGNMAAALFGSTILLFVALLIGLSLGGR